MVDKFSQVTGNVPVTNNDPNRRYTVINGYPVVLNFAKERAILRMAVVFGAIHEPLPTVL